MFRYFPDVKTAVVGSPLALTLVVSMLWTSGSEASEPSAAVARTPAQKPVQYGTASWHSPSRSGQDSRTASGRRWVAGEMIAAHRSLPLGSKVRVTNLQNGRDAIVQITDRGPYGRGRIIDLSLAAARELDIVNAGTGRVRVEVLPTRTFLN